MVISAESEQRNTLEDVSRPNPARKAVASSQKGGEAVCEEPKGSGQCNLVPEPVFQFSQWKEGTKKETLSLYGFIDQ